MKEENNLQGKTSRLLYFMSELEKGHKVNKTDYLKRFNIAERTFKDDLRELKENLKILRDDMKIKYSRLAGTYEAEYNHGYGNLKYNQAVILSKILLESRALRVEEVRDLLMLVKFSLLESLRKVNLSIIRNYRFRGTIRVNQSCLIYPLFLMLLRIRSLFLLSIRNTKVRMPIMMCYRSRLCLMTIIFIVWHIKLKKKMED